MLSGSGGGAGWDSQNKLGTTPSRAVMLSKDTELRVKDSASVVTYRKFVFGEKNKH